MDRPDPDELLDRIQRDEDRQQRGRLKIFFGASAGVGKTFAMLQAARRRRDEGIDVVVGVVETHGRKETLALLDGLETLAPARVAHRGRTLAEFDLDAALARKPQLLLVDELAHSNVPGSRHLKRWQDVHELLDAGIDVYTTVNVQHLESLNDVVGQITGIRVWETVPDRVFDRADEVTLVDLPPEELLDRMRDGKVYLPQQAERAVRNFFRKGNLIALRELALRRTADRVDAQMREYRADQSIERIWQARERIIVCVGPGPESATLVRSAARLAASLKADWLAVYVETPKLQRLPDARRERTLAALKLAAELGAETVTLPGDDVAATLVAYARMRNVSKLVVGAAASASVGWRGGFGHAAAARIVRAATDIDVTLINSPAVRDAAGREDRGERATRFAGLGDDARRSPTTAYAYALALCAAITAAGAGLADSIALANLVMLYLLGAVFAAARLGRGPGVVYSFLGVAAFDFFFVPPRMSFSVSDTQYLLTFAVMLLTSLTISHLTSSLRRQAHVATLRERRAGAMFAMTRELGAALATAQIIETGTRHVAEIFHARVAILLPDSAEKVKQKIENPDPAVTLDDASLDADIAQWVYDQQKPAGHGTDTLPAAVALYLPLKAPMRTRGVLALVSARMDELAVPEQRRMLETLAAQIALAVERVHYVEIAQDALVSMESERLRNSLLSAISHDLRTPLTSIVGFASLLAQQPHDATPAGRSAHELADAIHDEALRMTGLVTNLLDMARLQDGSMRLHRQWSSIEEVIGAALGGARRMLAGRRVTTHVSAELPLVQLDAVLVERLLANLLENAVKYTPDGTPVTLDARIVVDGDGRRRVRVDVLDNGPGLPAGMEARVFDKFTRGEKESAKPGIGLGLAICRAIVDAHDGRIGAANRVGADGRVSGACFWFELPADDAPPPAAGPADADADSDAGIDAKEGD
ncbi:sensor histidine kinase [Paraburkholderia caballeronis]|uniref:sensor histidine kinase n=1 Tax=Paraburkholderia caballeronis TaxID=416943 RepID=UPI001064B6DF|nr:sensor histidine kinase KdpD [Paraburkholderia caballeronis]TDV12216.1 osmosensitive K+ channel signal transduction histidine kinase [Paraburkholderia caballeronis]TDV15291.1 osmosensitive K+ channel signal transduction histidine kinase [Paraburkholderia caballeronis]TDV24663.1 osmosensitive K+ channel signal transduction histidine kinase [Paraburkholderia caballeronis]